VEIKIDKSLHNKDKNLLKNMGFNLFNQVLKIISIFKLYFLKSED